MSDNDDNFGEWNVLPLSPSMDIDTLINITNQTLDNINKDYPNLDDNNIESNKKTDVKTDKPKKVKKRCGVCKLKLTLVQRECGKCGCGGVYCGMHRMSENHECTFDHKTNGRAKLKKNNPKIVNSKIIKI